MAALEGAARLHEGLRQPRRAELAYRELLAMNPDHTGGRPGLHRPCQGSSAVRPQKQSIHCHSGLTRTPDPVNHGHSTPRYDTATVRSHGSTWLMLLQSSTEATVVGFGWVGGVCESIFILDV